jgi:hypothetical protein
VATSRDIGGLLAAIRDLPVSDRLKLVECVVHDLAVAELPRPEQDPMSVIGSFSDIDDAMRDVCEAAMVARERDPLRLANG